MMLFALLLSALPATGFGAPYPSAQLDGAPDLQFCLTRYRFFTADPIGAVAGFYRAEAARAHVPLLDDSDARFADYRTLVFVQQPRFLDVVLSRKGGRTLATVGFRAKAVAGC